MERPTVPREDLSSSQDAPAPLEPLSPQDLSPAFLSDLGRRVAHRTWRLGIERWFWGEGVALLGLVRFGQAAGTDDQERVSSWIAARLGRDLVLEHVNDLAPGIAALALEDGRRHLDALASLAKWSTESPTATRAGNGALEHWPGGVWADTMFMAGAFLARYGRASGDVSFIEEAGRQLIAHAEILQDERSGLFAHGSHRGETIWCFWGRANAWAALAAVEFLEVSAEGGVDEGLRTEVQERLARQLTTLAAIQPAHGVWDVLVDGMPETAGIVETSATAGIAAAMLRARELLPGLSPSVVEAGRRAARGALAYVDDEGALTRVSAGTILQLIPFGYSVIRDDRPQLWGQGLALAAIAAAIGDAARGPIGSEP